jgi:crotonobetainyl-CoA:carnitine CoA-transferase CaiB-like acyl-CoA transferase
MPMLSTHSSASGSARTRWPRCARFAEVEAPLAPVYSIDQILDDPHYRERQTFVEVPDEDLGAVTMQNVVPRLSRTPGTIRWAGRTHIGADTAAVLQRILGRRAADLPRPAEEPDTEHRISDP